MFLFDKQELNDTIEFINKHNDNNPLLNLLINELETNKGLPDLNDIEKEKADSFYKEHKHCCEDILDKLCFSTTGGGFSYIIKWTPIGCIYSYKCNSCHTEKDITDYNKIKENYNISELKNNYNRELLYKYHPFSFIITGTGLGSCISVKYTDVKDVTDIDSW